MELFNLCMFFIFGTIFGSFYNVVGLRTPEHIPYNSDRSFCPHCKMILQYYELIPVLSYIIQRGKCRSCKNRISIVYPVTELITGCLFAFSYLYFGWQWELIISLLFISLLMIVFVADISYMIIPNKILLFFLPIFIGLRLFIQLEPFYDALIGALLGYFLLLLIIVVSNGGMGAGDMKLFGVIGLVLGWKNILVTFFISSVIGALFGGWLIWSKKVNKSEPIPFGPFIVLAAIVSYFYGEYLIGLYVLFVIG